MTLTLTSGAQNFLDLDFEEDERRESEAAQVLVCILYFLRFFFPFIDF